LNRGAPARPALPSTPAEDALDEIPEDPLTVHTPPALHAEGVPRGATATRVMPAADLADDEIFGEPAEDDDTSSTAGNTPQLGDDGAFEVEHPVRFNELGTPLDGGKSYGDLGQSFSISRETLTDPASATAPAPRVRPSEASRPPAPAADDEGDLPWAEPIELDQESDDTPDDSIEAARFAERMPSLPPPPPPLDPPRAAPRPQAEPPRRAAASGAPASPVDSRAIHESLEKVAWEAFGPLSEQIMQEVVKRVEAIAWEVLPQLAERLIREEIAQLKKG
jgi:hypothetical protein